MNFNIKEIRMANLASLLKSEIARIAKKETKSQFVNMNSKIAELKKNLLAHKKQVKNLEGELQSMHKRFGTADKVPAIAAELLVKSRLSGSSIARLRHKLKLSRALFGKLLGASQNTIYLWEVDKTSPRSDMKAKIVQLRKTGKREIKKILRENKKG